MSPPLLAPVRPALRALVETVVPEARTLEPPEWDELEGLIDDAIRPRGASVARQIRTFLRLVEWLPVARYGRRFSGLDPERRRRVLTRLERHPIQLLRAGTWGVRTLAFLGYYGRPAARAAIGYRPDPRGWEAA